MVQGQKRNPHKTTEGMTERTVVGENEIPGDQKTTHWARNKEHSCTPEPHQGKPGVEGPIRSQSIP